MPSKKPYDPNEGVGYSRVGTGSSEDDGVTLASGFTLESSGNSTIQDSLIGGPAVGQTFPVTAATAMMQVTAPATLPEGYEFDARIGERTVKVVVPEGGVEIGQTFSVPLPEVVGSLITGSISIPVGHWRDGLFDIFHYGACHPAVWASCCCHLCKLTILSVGLKLSLSCIFIQCIVRELRRGMGITMITTHTFAFFTA
jgi:hypothetical protein